MFANPRLLVARILTVTFLIQILLCMPLWHMQSRSFIAVPLLPVSQDVVQMLGVFGFSALCALLMVRIVRPDWQSARIALIVVLLALICLDVHRLQVWVWFYLLWLICFEQLDQPRGLRLLLAAVYLWGGLNKINVHFLEGVVPEWQAALQLTGSAWKWLLACLAIAMELWLASLLLLNKWSLTALLMACLLHTCIIVSLALQGSWNVVVWPWNIALVMCIYVIHVTRITPNRAEAPIPVFSMLGGFLAYVMPATYSLGVWPYTLSWMLYSGLQPELTLSSQRPSDASFSAEVRNHVFGTESEEHIMMDDWTFAEARVPAFQHPYVYARIRTHWCAAGEGRSVFTLYPERFCTECAEPVRKKCTD